MICFHIPSSIVFIFVCAHLLLIKFTSFVAYWIWFGFFFFYLNFWKRKQNGAYTQISTINLNKIKESAFESSFKLRIAIGKPIGDIEVYIILQSEFLENITTKKCTKICWNEKAWAQIFFLMNFFYKIKLQKSWT